MNTINSFFLTIILCIVSNFTIVYGSEFVNTMQLLSASKAKKERAVNIIQAEYDKALRDPEFDVEKLKQIKQLLFSAEDDLLVVTKRITEEFLRRKSVKRNEK